jgi:hypothetical protein
MSAAATSLEPDGQEHQGQIRHLGGEIARLTTETDVKIAPVEDEITAVKGRITVVEGKITVVEEEIATIKSQLARPQETWGGLDEFVQNLHDNDPKKWWPQKEDQLKQLNREKEQLNDQLKQLNDQLKQLNRKEEQLNERLNMMIEQQSRLLLASGMLLVVMGVSRSRCAVPFSVPSSLTTVASVLQRTTQHLHHFAAKASGAKRARGDDDAGEGHGKRIAILQRGEPTDIGVLFSRFDETRMDESVYTFAASLLDSRTKMLWVRPVYPELYAAVWKRAINGEKFFPIIITGTSGIGKSFFGIYAMFRAVRERQITVVYKTYGADDDKRIFVIAPPEATMAKFAEKDPKRLLLKLRDTFPGMIGEDKMDAEEDSHKTNKSIWWGEVDKEAPYSTQFVRQLLGGTSTWLFVDIQHGTVAESCHRTVVLVSDNIESTRSFAKHQSAISLVMPVWTEQELLHARNAAKLHLSEDDVKERYMKVGGVPRSVFSLQY